MSLSGIIREEENSMKTRHVLVLAVALIIGLSILTVAQNTVTWEGILPGISSELGGTYAINVATTASTVGLDVSEETALTNTVNGTIKSTHTTSGTPANSIGNGYWVYQETSAANTEKVMELNAVMTDVTAGSEDASFSIELMAAGAESAEVLSISPVGVASLAGGMTVNDDSGDYDFIVESDDDTAAFKVDAGLDTAIFGAWEASTIATDTTTSYSISSASKASYHIQTAGLVGAGTTHLMTDLLTSPGPGGKIILKTGDSNDLVVDTEGAATIDGAATYTIDGTLEAVTFITDGTNWHVVGSYLE